jgi:hypothetical protein
LIGVTPTTIGDGNLQNSGQSDEALSLAMRILLEKRPTPVCLVQKFKHSAIHGNRQASSDEIAS